jgi:hypothetical protein
MLGGARIVRLVVLQESKITASATAPPAPHNKLSRLPWIHRVSLERHTNGEYAQKQKLMTTHFFGLSATRLSEFCLSDRRAYRSGAILRRRFTRKSFENAIELRQRLKARRERDFADAQITVSQEITRSVETSACDVFDKLHTGYLLEFFAEIIRVNIDRFRHPREGKFFA